MPRTVLLIGNAVLEYGFTGPVEYDARCVLTAETVLEVRELEYCDIKDIEATIDEAKAEGLYDERDPFPKPPRTIPLRAQQRSLEPPANCRPRSNP